MNTNTYSCFCEHRKYRGTPVYVAKRLVLDTIGKRDKKYWYSQLNLPHLKDKLYTFNYVRIYNYLDTGVFRQNLRSATLYKDNKHFKWDQLEDGESATATYQTRFYNLLPLSTWLSEKHNSLWRHTRKFSRSKLYTSSDTLRAYKKNPTLCTQSSSKT